MDVNLEQEETDIELDINFEEQEQEEESFLKDVKQSLQRTKEWYYLRVGKFTASQIKHLMACSPKGGRLSWNDREKWLMFSNKTPKFIFGIAMERKKKFSIANKPNKEMKYGALIEPFITRRFNEVMKDHGFEVCEVGFNESNEIKNLGASSDGKVFGPHGQIFNYEQKATASWSGYYDRIYDFEDEKSLDFWQIQSQMVVNNTTETYYVIASPPEDIDIYLKAEDLDSLYDKWVVEVDLKINVVKKSEIHCNALIKRVQIADDIVEEFLRTEHNINEIFYKRLQQEITPNNTNVLQEQNNALQQAPIALEGYKESFLEQFLTEQPKQKEVQIDYNDLPF